MQRQKRLSALFLTLCLVFVMSVSAYAQEVPDVSKNGSISVTMLYDNKVVPGGALTLYQVGKIHEDDGNYSFELTDSFAGSGVSLEKISSTTPADTLAVYAFDNNLTGKTEEIGSDGKVTVSDLIPGLYLVVQSKAAEGFEAINPFLVSVPMYEDGAYIYHVDATPKMGPLKEIPTEPTTPPTEPTEPPTEPTPPPTEPTEPPTEPTTPPTEPTQPPTEPTTPPVEPTTPPAEPTQPPVVPNNSNTPPSNTTLPQTGQMNWPIPVLTVIGLCLFLIGWILYFGKQDRSHEA